MKNCNICILKFKVNAYTLYLQIQVIIGSTSQSFVFTSKAFKTGYTICNNAFHSVTMTINIASVTLNIDGSYSETKNFDTFQYAAPLSIPIYLAGVKGRTKYKYF